MKRMIVGYLLIVMLVLSGCSQATDTTSSNEIGELIFVANGEDFTRKGFTSKDGWEISFEHIYVTLADVKAYQTNPPYDSHSEEEITGEVEVTLEGTKTIDLAEGDENAEPIIVGNIGDAPVGHYNAMSWKVVKGVEGIAKDNAYVFIGTAQRDGRKINFNIKFDKEYKFLAGEYLGDERKGFVEEKNPGDLEMTFHFDHLFGDIETDLDDSLNVGAIGFEPFAKLANEEKVDINMKDLEEQFNDGELGKLTEIFSSLGHVGEGHCHAEEL